MIGRSSPPLPGHGASKGRHDTWTVVLKEKNAERYLPIWIDKAQVDAIAIKLQGVHVPRPLTHDLLIQVLEVFGANIDSIVISDFKNDTFYAKIILYGDRGRTEIDSRPSDALALAVRVGAPILAEGEILDMKAVATSPAL